MEDGVHSDQISTVVHKMGGGGRGGTSFFFLAMPSVKRFLCTAALAAISFWLALSFSSGLRSSFGCNTAQQEHSAHKSNDQIDSREEQQSCTDD